MTVKSIPPAMKANRVQYCDDEVNQLRLSHEGLQLEIEIPHKGTWRQSQQRASILGKLTRAKIASAPQRRP